MTAPEEQAPPVETAPEKAPDKSIKKGFFGGKAKSDDGSMVSKASQKQPTTNWLGKEVKRPRAEYQAEIDELKLKVASLEAQLERTTSDLQQFKDWVSMAPSAF